MSRVPTKGARPSQKTLKPETPVVSGFRRWWALLALLVPVWAGCQGPPQRPTLDYAPENVKIIRETQQLEWPADAAAQSEEPPEEGR